MGFVVQPTITVLVSALLLQPTPTRTYIKTLMLVYTVAKVVVRVRVDLIGHARIRYVGKYQSCMV